MELCVFTEPQQGATYLQLLTVAQTAERLGFTAFFRSDHFLRMGSGSGLNRRTYDVFQADFGARHQRLRN